MAQDETLKRQNMERNTIIYVTQLLTALNGLADIQSERSKLVQDFQAADFSPSDLTHLTAAQIGTFYDFCLPTFQATLTDAGNGGRNIQIMQQIRNG